MDGKYSIVLNTNMGVERGILVVNTNGDTLSGYIVARGVNNYFNNGKKIGNKFEFSGEIKVMFMRIQYYATGVIKGNKIEGFAKTKYGNFAMKGTKI